MPKLSHREIIDTVASEQENILTCCDNSHMFFCMLSDLNREELVQLRSKVEKGNELYHVIESMIRSKPDKSLERAEYKDLLRWFKDGEKGKVSRARTVLKSRYDYLSTRERREIVDAFLEKNKPSDRKWVYKKLTEEWDERYQSKIEELWNEYHEDACGMLIIKHLSLPFIIKHRNELDNGKSHYWLVNRLAQSPFWPLDSSKLSTLEYLRLICYSKRIVSDSDVRIALYRTVSIIVNEKKRLMSFTDRFADGTSYLSIPFDMSTYDFHDVEKALWYIGKAGYVSVIMDYAKWVMDNSLINQVSSKQRSATYCKWMASIPEAERQQKGEELMSLVYQEFYTNIVNNFPKEYKWMFDDIDEKIKDKNSLKYTTWTINYILYKDAQDIISKGREQDQNMNCEASKDDSHKTLDDEYRLLNSMRQNNSSIDRLVQSLGLKLVFPNQ